jgi:hypothetical protein
VALMFKTHPAMDDRLSRLDQAMSGRFDQFENQPELAPRFMRTLEAGKK